jgi:tRNA-2-methylthio-N6-dimethylallyladenosine synthase|tara:strand:+ start:212 stop:1540 length:1329 start_codon:yes stop_codon:yes gene_type:complete
MPEVRKFFIQTHGCQMNEYDSNKLCDILKSTSNYEETKVAEEADLLLLNTCSIREKAQEKVFDQLGRWKKLKKHNSNVLIAVGGCVATQEGENIKKRAPQVDIVFGPQTIHRIPSMINKASQKNNKLAIDVTFPSIEKFDYIPVPKSCAVSEFVTIMEGCSKYCSFCVVPYTRGEEVNRSLDEVLFEVNNLALKGVKEIVLLGQNVNSYKSNTINGDTVKFSDLIKYLSLIDGIERIRHTTSHPIDFGDDLIEEYRNTKLANNLHLPVQSGSDTILAQMKRKHTSLEYRNIIRKVKMIRPDINLTTDIIVGYPGETDHDFQRTLELVEDMNFSDAYTFIYSSRPGTPAAGVKDTISIEEKKRRLYELQELIREQSKTYSQKMLGTTQKVLIEGFSVKTPKELYGRSDNNKIVNFPSAKNMIGKFTNVMITEIRTNTLYGEIV